MQMNLHVRNVFTLHKIQSNSFVTSLMRNSVLKKECIIKEIFSKEKKWKPPFSSLGELASVLMNSDISSFENGVD